MDKYDLEADGTKQFTSENSAQIFTLAMSGGHLYKKVCDEWFKIEQIKKGRSVTDIESGEYEIRLSSGCGENSWICVDDSKSNKKRPLEKICMVKDNMPPVTAWADAYILDDTITINYYDSDGAELDTSEYIVSSCC